MPCSNRVGFWTARDVFSSGFLLVVAYLQASVGLNHDNLAILNDVAAALHGLQRPISIVCDWNIIPLELSTSGWLGAVGGRVCAPSRPTCLHGQAARVLDYAVFSRHWPTGNAKAELCDDWSASPHSAVHVEMPLAMRTTMCKGFRQPRGFPRGIPFGPRCEHHDSRPDFELDPTRASSDKSYLDGAVQRWFAFAEDELAELYAVDTDDSGKRVIGFRGRGSVPIVRNVPLFSTIQGTCCRHFAILISTPHCRTFERIHAFAVALSPNL